jgi:PAS domain S-box-containing protein
MDINNESLNGNISDLIQNEIESKNEILNKIISNLPVIICRIDQQGNFKQLMGRGLERIGLSDNELNGKSILEVYPQISSSVKKVLEGETVSFISSINYKGRNNFFENYYFPDKNGSIGLIIDITERKESEEKIKKNEMLLREAQELANMGIWEWDIQSNQMSWSNELYRIYGYEKHELNIEIQRFMNQIHPDDFESFRKIIEKAFNDHRKFSFEYRIIRSDGTIRNICGEGKPVINDHGIVRINGFCQDITERKKIEEELRKKNRELKTAEEALIEANLGLERKIKQRTEELLYKNEQLSKINSDLDNFIYTASHDLKAPISNIDGLVRTLSEIIPDDQKDIKNIIDMINICIRRFQGTITDLTDITKAQKNLDEENEEVDYIGICEEIKSSLQNMIIESGANIYLDFKSCERIKFSRKNLRSILYNLISNAIKYRSPERKPEIYIRTESTIDDYILLSVSDNGLGFDESNKEKAFSMFKRLHDHVEGSGVGLYIVKKIIENNGGKIDVESEVDKGSRFKIYFKI